MTWHDIKNNKTNLKGKCAASNLVVVLYIQPRIDSYRTDSNHSDCTAPTPLRQRRRRPRWQIYVSSSLDSLSPRLPSLARRGARPPPPHVATSSRLAGSARRKASIHPSIHPVNNVGSAMGRATHEGHRSVVQSNGWGSSKTTGRRKMNLLSFVGSCFSLAKKACRLVNSSEACAFIGRLEATFHPTHRALRLGGSKRL